MTGELQHHLMRHARVRYALFSEVLPLETPHKPKLRGKIRIAFGGYFAPTLQTLLPVRRNITPQFHKSYERR